jgi:hypothetical protein
MRRATLRIEPLEDRTCPSGSVFVSTAGNDASSGGPFDPVRTINRAIALVSNGGTINIGAGVYNENVYIFGRNSVSFEGAGYTNTFIAPLSGDATIVDRSNNILFNGIGFAAVGANGRGLIVLGSSVTTLSTDTQLTQNEGAIVAPYFGQSASLTTNSSHFDSTHAGNGLVMDSSFQAGLGGASTAFLQSSTFDHNAVSVEGSISKGASIGYGLLVNTGTAAYATGCTFTGDVTGGLGDTGNGNLAVLNSVLSNTVQGDGALISQTATGNFYNDLFMANGLARGLSNGFNGLELLTGYTGVTNVTACAFVNNTAFGMFDNSATNTVQVIGSLFNDNYVGFGIDGNSVGPLGATLKANYFRTGSDSATPLQDVGIFALGSNVTLAIGGPQATDANTFAGFQSYFSISPAAVGESPPKNLGCPNLQIFQNNFPGSGAPFVLPCP